jgi:hypothetical protein
MLNLLLQSIGHLTFFHTGKTEFHYKGNEITKSMFEPNKNSKLKNQTYEYRPFN